MNYTDLRWNRIHIVQQTENRLSHLPMECVGETTRLGGRLPDWLLAGRAKDWWDIERLRELGNNGRSGESREPENSTINQGFYFLQ